MERLTPEERSSRERARRKKSVERLFNSYKRDHPIEKGGPEQWKKAAEALLSIIGKESDHLAALGLQSRPKTMGDLKHARREAMKKSHPDKAGGSEELAKKVNEAYSFFEKKIGEATQQPGPKATTEAQRKPSEIPIVNPAECSASLPDDLNNSNLVTETKMDGSRYALYLGKDPYGRQSKNALLSRRLSSVDGKHVDRTGNVPHITDQEYGLDGTILDGEIFLKDFETTQPIMGSDCDTAVEKQKIVGFLDYYVFDIPFYCGQDIRQKPLSERRKILEEVVGKMANKHVKLMPRWTGDIKGSFEKITAAGGEGLIIKDQRLGYGIGWAKMKKSYDVSCFITGFKPGKGKYAGSIGSIEVSVNNNGQEFAVGFASGFDDALRDDMAKNPGKYMYAVVDVFAQEIGKNGRLRHPTFHRFRKDMSVENCTMIKLRKDLKAKAKSRRE